MDKANINGRRLCHCGVFQDQVRNHMESQRKIGRTKPLIIKINLIISKPKLIKFRTFRLNTTVGLFMMKEIMNGFPIWSFITLVTQFN